MATPAVGTEFAVMDVVGPVTVAATAVESRDLVEGCSMAVIAADVYVGTVQRKVGLQIVIEGPDIPGDRSVARVTSAPEIAVV